MSGMDQAPALIHRQATQSSTSLVCSAM
jgi:hypothetical protein